MLEKTGIPGNEQVETAFPPMERLQQGPAAVIECFQRIPCNPCSTACRRGALTVGEDINETPRVDYEKCNGCGLCVSRCPGLAIMVVDYTYGGDEALLSLPYEFMPLPSPGDTVTALDRAGEPVGSARVVKVTNTKANDRTPVVALAVKKDLVKTVRHFKPIEQAEPTIVCRCSDLDLDYIRGLIKKGYTSVDEIKRICRLGMGPCQGRNCVPLVLNELSRALGKPVAELAPGAYRPVTRSISLGAVADSLLKEDENDK